MLDESTFSASPGQAVSSIAGKLRNHADQKHPEQGSGERS